MDPERVFALDLPGILLRPHNGWWVAWKAEAARLSPSPAASVPVIDIPVTEITDWDSFHDVFAPTVDVGRKSEARECLGPTDAQEFGAVGYPDATRVNSLLTEICRERGWCLPPDGEERVRKAIPDGIDMVVDTIIWVEMEMDPVLCDKSTRRWLRGKVDDWLFRRAGRGASSGLPL